MLKMTIYKRRKKCYNMPMLGRCARPIILRKQEI